MLMQFNTKVTHRNYFTERNKILWNGKESTDTEQ